MTVACPDCRSVFRVDPAKVPASGVRARCSVCGGVIAITGGTLPVMVTPASAGVVRAGFATPRDAAVPPQASAGVGPAFAAQGHGMSAAAAHVAPAAPMHSATSPTDPALSAPTPRAPTPAYGMPAHQANSGATAAPASAPPRPTGPAIAAVASRTPARPAPAVTPAFAAPAASPDAPRRPINPFLKADPSQRARRLARALVSDLVAYHPQKREEGIRNGTLRQLFREEIKKSYEEYVDQVGRELAESAPHFQEALNEILGGGRKLF